MQYTTDEYSSVTGDHDVTWDLDQGGLETRKDGIVVESSDGDVHAELDVDGSKEESNAYISTDVTLNDNSSEYTLSFDIQARPKFEDSSDMRITFNGMAIEIDVEVDSNDEPIYNIINNNANADITIEPVDDGSDWMNVTINYHNVDANSATLVSCKALMIVMDILVLCYTHER